MSAHEPTIILSALSLESPGPLKNKTSDLMITIAIAIFIRDSECSE